MDAIRTTRPRSFIYVFGDHGPCTAWHIQVRGINATWRGDGNDYLRDSNSILNAFCLPENRPPEWAYASISPVNVIRGFLRTQFGLALPPLDDTAWFFPPGSVQITPSHGHFEYPEFTAKPSIPR